MSFIQLFWIFQIWLICVEGYAKIAFSVSLSSNVAISKVGWKKIATWSVPSNTGNVKSSATISNGQFDASISGIYSVYTTVTLSGANEGLFKVLIVRNNNFQTIHRGLQSSQEAYNGFQSLSVFGTIRLQSQETLAVYVYSEVDTDWIVIGNSESSFNVEFVGFYGDIPGFSGYLAANQAIITSSEWIAVSKWQASNEPSLFKSRTGFSEDAGVFSPICNGFYQLSANVEFLTHLTGTYSVGIAVNDDTTGNIVTRTEQLTNKTMSISISVGLMLKKGEIVTLKTKGSSEYSISKNSGFFGVLVNKADSVTGFSTVFMTPNSGNGQTWVSIPIPEPTTGYGQLDTNQENSIRSGRFYNKNTKVYTVSAVLHIESSSSSGIIMSLQNDASSLLIHKSGLYTTRYSDAMSTSYAVCGILELPANQPLSLYIYLSTQEKYQVLNGSRISIIETQQEYQAFHVATANALSISSSDTWILVDIWETLGVGSYSLTSNFNGQYIAGVTGIYYFATNMIFTKVDGPISVLISLNGDTSKRRSLHATKGNPASSEDTITITGALFIEAGSNVGLYVMVENDLSWDISKDSTFSAIFIGQPSVVKGISTVLKKKVPIAEVGWVKIQDWQSQKVATMFDTSGSFDPLLGNFMVAQSGMYLVAACIRLQDASAKSSTFLLTVSIDSQPQKYSRQNALQDYIENNFNPPPSNDFYTLVVGGVMKLKKGQIISLYIRNTVDDSFSISQDSSFSVVFLSPENSGYNSGMQVMLSDSISQEVNDETYWRKVRHWVTSSSGTNTASGLFYQGSLQELDRDGGVITVSESGVYLINVNVAIKGSFDFELALHTIHGVAALLSKYGKTAREVNTMKLYGIIFLNSGQSISIKVRSTSPIASWENLKAHTGWCFIRIPPFTVLPSYSSGLLKDTFIETSASLWSRITAWTMSMSPVQESSGEGFDSDRGYFTAPYSGIYLITCSISFTSNQTGYGALRQKIGINGDTSLPGLKVINSGDGASFLITNCNGGCAYPMTQLLQLNVGDKVAVYVQSSTENVVVYSSTSLTIKHVSSLNPLPDSFSMQLEQTISVIVYGNKQLVSWTSSANSGQFYKDSGGSTSEYLITTTGLYLVSVNINFEDLLGLALAMPSLDNIPILSSVYYSVESSSFTLPVAGVMFINSGSVYTVTIQTGGDQSYKVSRDSTSSLLYIGQKSNSLGFTGTFTKKSSYSCQSHRWVSIKSWSTIGKDWLFENGLGFENKEAYIIQESGHYFIAANIILSNQQNFSAEVELALVLNNHNDFRNGLFGKSRVHSDGKCTLQIQGGIYLNKWDYLQLWFRTNITMEFYMEKDSTYSVVKLGTDLNASPCIDSGPNIVGRIMPDDIRQQVGSSRSWDCFATGDSPAYQWIKNFQNIPGATSSLMSLVNMTVENSGSYMCQATIGGIKSYSNIAQLVVFDPKPKLLNKWLDFTITTPENGSDYLELVQLKATAESINYKYSKMSFEIIGGDPEHQFTLMPNISADGTTLARIKQLDREEIDTYVLQLKITNMRTPSEHTVYNITVFVEDLNDNPPVFKWSIYNLTLTENTTVSTVVTTMSATDADIGDNAALKYLLIPGSATGVFGIDEKTGKIVLISQVDREKNSFYVLSISVTDGASTMYSELTVYIGDVNEHAPYFLKTDYNVEISENIVPGVSLLKIKTADKDAGINAKITYLIEKGDDDRVFIITESGDLQTTKFLDYETNSSYILQVAIHDNGNPMLWSSQKAFVNVQIHNSNDNKPQFKQSQYSAEIQENAQYFTPTFTVKANDPDKEGVGNILYTIPSSENVSDIFDVIRLTGIIELKLPLDFEEKEFYQFTVEASDDGVPPRVSTTNVLVHVIDVNDNRPIFEITTNDLDVMESTDTGRILYQVSASDLDSGANSFVTYRIVDGNENDLFYVNPITGAVMATKPLDRELGSYYRLKITAFDSGFPPLSSEVPFSLDINIIDYNDNAPVFDRSEYSMTVREDAPTGTSIGTFEVKDLDQGNNGHFNITVLESVFKDLFTVIYHSDFQYSLTLLKPLNYEERSLYQFTVVAKDNGSPSLEKAVSVKVGVVDVNDNAPKFQKYSHATTLADTSLANETIYQLVATDPDVGPGRKLSYEIIGGNVGNAFVVDQDIVRTADRENLTFITVYELKLVAKDTYEPPLVSHVFTLYIRVSRTPNILLSDVKVGQFQISAVISLADLSHLDNIVKYQVLVQMIEDNPLLNVYSDAVPVTWHDIFSPDTSINSNHLRRYVALESDFPQPYPEEISVTIGNNVSCTKAEMVSSTVCNGPLSAGKMYRLQLRVYEKESTVPIESHFSQPIQISIIGPSKATLSEPIEDGMVALAATFCIVFLSVIFITFIYICWKSQHELLNVDHLREIHGMPIQSSADNPEGFLSPYGRFGKFAGFDNGMWPELSMAENNLMLQRSSKSDGNVPIDQNDRSIHNRAFEYQEFGQSEEHKPYTNKQDDLMRSDPQDDESTDQEMETTFGDDF